MYKSGEWRLGGRRGSVGGSAGSEPPWLCTPPVLEEDLNDFPYEAHWLKIDEWYTEEWVKSAHSHLEQIVRKRYVNEFGGLRRLEEPVEGALEFLRETEAVAELQILAGQFPNRHDEFIALHHMARYLRQRLIIPTKIFTLVDRLSEVVHCIEGRRAGGEACAARPCAARRLSLEVDAAQCDEMTVSRLMYNLSRALWDEVLPPLMK